ncbi:MAG: formate-dependent phosphoribosylglycinamide formyltransferase [Candidatus Peregrinibacteria bacterium]|nr:formate-dependent phosphoribosylglycinamide formyltransferase [Candidatus Peregrinibacteria bacterium]
MLGTPLSDTSKKLMLLGSGELGKEVIIEAQRLGVETIAIDRYENAPAMQVSHHSRTINMQDENELRKVVEEFQPDYIVPEIEAINTEFLLELEKEGFNIIPTARTTNLTMDREGIRRLAAEELSLPTAKFEFAETLEEFKTGVKKIGIPCVVKPIQSSSGHGQSTVKTEDDIVKAWNFALEDSRGDSTKVIIEEFIKFDSEITLLTVREKSGDIKFCDPIGHIQVSGDYRESWQPQLYSNDVMIKCQEVAHSIVDNLGGTGIFGCELFIRGDEVLFSEISPRPHDTGMVTLISQNMTEFELHVRAILGLPIPEIKTIVKGAASHVVLADRDSDKISFSGVEEALKTPNSSVRIFGKPTSRPHRRMGVCLATGENTDDARQKAENMSKKISIIYKN